MMERKEVVCEEWVRRVPRQFSWVDHRLVRDGFCRRCRPEDLPRLLKPTAGGPLHFAIDGDAAHQFVPYWPITREVFTCYPAVGV